MTELDLKTGNQILKTPKAEKISAFFVLFDYNEILYFNGSEPISGMDPNVPDLFVVVTEDENSLHPEPLLEFVAGLNITIHEIYDIIKVGDFNDRQSPVYRQVCQESPQRAVRLHLSTDMGGFVSCPPPENLVVGIANIGTTMDINAQGTVYTSRIRKKVQCLYEEAGNTNQTAMMEDIEKFIKGE